MDSGTNGESNSISKNNDQNTSYRRRRRGHHHHHHHFKSREPLQKHQNLQFHHAQGPFSFLNPTRAHFTFHPPPASQRGVKFVPREEEGEGDEIIASGAGADDHDHDHHITKPPPSTTRTRTQLAQHVRFLWRARDNRKGRHAIQITSPPQGSTKRKITVPQHTSHPYQILLGVKRTLTYFPIWDISWLVAMTFTLGSVVWVLNGFFSWLPVVAPSTEFPGESEYAGGISAFVGAIVFFEVGSILLVIEAVNADQVGCFGWAVEEVFFEKGEKKNQKDSSSLYGGGDGGGEQRYRLMPSIAHCRHHHQNKRNLVGKPSRKHLELTSTSTSTSTSTTTSTSSWQWLPTLTSLRTHYIHDLGFLAGATQLFAATVFGVSGITALPGINNHLTPQWRLNAAYWIPQVIGGAGFIVSSSLYLLETQRKWYIPAPRVLGWHIAFWNLIGSVGFTLCGALGMVYGSSGAQYQAGLATFWYVLM